MSFAQPNPSSINGELGMAYYLLNSFHMKNDHTFGGPIVLQGVHSEKRVAENESFMRGQNGCGTIPMNGCASRHKSAVGLSPREREILQFIADGYANKQTASELHISIKTVEKHRQNLSDKLGIHGTARLTRYAIHAGVVQ